MRYIETKTILSKLRTADRWFGIAYNMNLYRGCQHGCIYCDTRSDCYGIGDIAQIAVKRNALELLPAELRARRKKRATIGTGSMNDPYMPVERELRLTRRALGMIADERFPVHVITKSSLAERDADILQEISATYAAVSFTVTCADDALSVRTEPGAPASSERFRAMAALAAKGIYTGVTMMPLLPLINDTRENVEAIVRRAKDAGGIVYPPDVRRNAPQRVARAFPRNPRPGIPRAESTLRSLFRQPLRMLQPQLPEVGRHVPEPVRETGARNPDAVLRPHPARTGVAVLNSRSVPAGPYFGKIIRGGTSHLHMGDAGMRSHCTLLHPGIERSGFPHYRNFPFSRYTPTCVVFLSWRQTEMTESNERY